MTMRKVDPQLLNYIMPFEHIIWDWNGTLLDDIKLVLNLLGDIMETQGLSRPSASQYKEVFGFPIQKYYEKLGFSFNDQMSFLKLSDVYNTQYLERLEEARVFDGMIEILEMLTSRKVISILSAASQEHLEVVLNRLNVRKYFHHVFGLPNNLAQGKVEIGKQLLQKVPIDLHKTLLIGDTDHDVEVGHQLGVQVLIIADGHQSYERLNKIHHSVMPTRFLESEFHT